MRPGMAAVGLVVTLVAVGLVRSWQFFPRPAVSSASSLGGVRERSASPRPLRPVPVPVYRLAPAHKTTLLAEVTRWNHAKVASVGVMIHALRLRNLAQQTLHDAKDVEFYDLLLRSVLSDAEYDKWCVRSPLLFDTPYGAGYRTQWRESGPGAEFAGGMTHVDKVLSTLGELGVSLTTEVVTNSGTRYTLADVLEDSLRRWHSERESEWTLIAYCDYLHSQREWESTDGRRRSIDDVLEAVLRQKTLGPCFGTHRLYALAKACVRSRATPGFFNPSIIAKAEQELQRVSDLLTEKQHPGGYWDPQAIEAGELRWLAEAGPEDTRLRLYVTGHMLEWFAIADEDLRPPRATIRRAAVFVEDQLRRMPEAYFDSYFLPASTHAIRALFHLSEEG